ncbi:hypothetical protein EVG20_g8824 [Dentipellis fragilis]|uniref:Uncharacterized protein n=1 Tax=Dentipellis fragilis TaxID=205917 RepID=A0A4Y9Y3D7_9AGAM|nr:hypothetical protein EVG20_g8824 [Dentipellis fragilis]
MHFNREESNGGFPGPAGPTASADADGGAGAPARPADAVPELCAQCFEGVKHEDTSTGLHHLDLCTSRLHRLVNNRLLADSFAANGLRVVLPDMFDGEPIPEDALELGYAVSCADKRRTRSTAWRDGRDMGRRQRIRGSTR